MLSILLNYTFSIRIFVWVFVSYFGSGLSFCSSITSNTHYLICLYLYPYLLMYSRVSFRKFVFLKLFTVTIGFPWRYMQSKLGASRLWISSIEFMLLFYKFSTSRFLSAMFWKSWKNLLNPWLPKWIKIYQATKRHDPTEYKI